MSIGKYLLISNRKQAQSNSIFHLSQICLIIIYSTNRHCRSPAYMKYTADVMRSRRKLAQSQLDFTIYISITMEIHHNLFQQHEKRKICMEYTLCYFLVNQRSLSQSKQIAMPNKFSWGLIKMHVVSLTLYKCRKIRSPGKWQIRMFAL